MGLWNPEAFCPNCGKPIETHREGIRTRTERTCKSCGSALTGKTKMKGGRTLGVLAPR
jgi:hypothetical protein